MNETRNRMLAAEVTTEPGLSVGAPRFLFEGDFYDQGRGPSVSHDLAPDGQKFVMIQDLSEPRLNELQIVQNWFEEVKRLVPTN